MGMLPLGSSTYLDPFSLPNILNNFVSQKNRSCGNVPQWQLPHQTSPIGHPHKNDIKLIIRESEEPCLVLKKDIQLNEISKMENLVVVGHLANKCMSIIVLRKWTDQHFNPLMGNSH